MIKTVDKIKAELVSNKWQARHRPIELQTENGFSIIRRCDIDKSISASGTEHRFIVRDPDEYELEIAVDIADEAVAEIVRRSRERLSLESSYWINCAERHLAIQDYYLGAHAPDLSDEEIDFTHRLWLEVTHERGLEDIRHKEIVVVAITRPADELHDQPPASTSVPAKF